MKINWAKQKEIAIAILFLVSVVVGGYLLKIPNLTLFVFLGGVWIGLLISYIEDWVRK